MLLRHGEPGWVTSSYRARTWTANAAGEVDEGSVTKRYLSDDGEIAELDRWVDWQVESGQANAGDVQMWVIGFGWLPYKD